MYRKYIQTINEELSKIGDSSQTYIGEDNDGNKYWCIPYNQDAIVILNKYGEIIDIFNYNFGIFGNMLPTVHPSGDIYLLDYDEDYHYLKMIKRVW